MEENLPPGFRFHPTDEELITYYLAHKLSDFAFTTRAIADVDLNKCEPWDLPGKANMGGKEWYFFSLRDRKYPTGLRTNRATDAGYWKTTGKDKEIFHCGVMVGMKKTLVFYKGRAPKGEKTSWVMHEYRHLNKSAFNHTKDEWVVSRVFRKTLNGKKLQQSMAAAAAAAMSPLMDSPCDGGTTSAGELADMDLSILRNIVVNSSTPPFNGVPPDNPQACTSIIAEGNGRTDLKEAYIHWLLNRGVMSQLPAAATAPWSSSLACSAALLRALQLSHGHPTNEMPSSSSFNSVPSVLGFPSFGSGSDPSVVNMNVNVNAPPSSQMLMFEQHEAFDQEAIWKSC